MSCALIALKDPQRAGADTGDAINERSNAAEVAGRAGVGQADAVAVAVKRRRSKKLCRGEIEDQLLRRMR